MAGETPFRDEAIEAGRLFVNAVNDFIGSDEAPEDYQRGLTLVEYREEVEEALAFLERLGA